MKGILGIDPGMQGGFAYLTDDGKEVVVEPMPTQGKELDLVEIARLLAFFAPEIEMAFLERAGMRRQQRMQDAFKSGQNFGVMQGVLGALSIPHQIVRPEVWSAEFAHGVTEQDKHKRYTAIKQARKKIAAQLFPGVDLRESARCKTAHEGMTDALLIAEWGRRQRKKGNA